jgi:hypothetical protein
VGQKRKRLDKTLRNQQTVERVSMNEWKPGDAGRMDCGNRQLEKVDLGQRGQQLAEIDPKIFASERAFDRNFQNTRALLAVAQSRKWGIRVHRDRSISDQELVYSAPSAPPQ